MKSFIVRLRAVMLSVVVAVGAVWLAGCGQDECAACIEKYDEELSGCESYYGEIARAECKRNAESQKKKCAYKNCKAVMVVSCVGAVDATGYDCGTSWYWWMSAENESAYCRRIDDNLNDVNEYEFNRNFGFSVR